MDNEDITRELNKIYDTLTAVQMHLEYRDRMNAALHMSTEVRFAPLTSAVKNARAVASDLVSRLTTGASNQSSS
jgi:hypothetical protein